MNLATFLQKVAMCDGTVIGLRAFGNRKGMNTFRALWACFALLSFVGCGCHGVVGSGVSKTETRDLPPFHRIEVDDSLSVTLTDRPLESLSIITDDNLIEHITTEVTDGGALHVGVKGHHFLAPRSGLNIEVPRLSIDEIGVEGAAQVTAQGPIVCDRVAFAASGASKLKLQRVVAQELVIWLSGASAVEAESLTADKAELRLSGASELSATAGNIRELTVGLSGASELNISGVQSETAALDLSGASGARLHASKAVSGNLSGGSAARVSGNPAERSLATSGASAVKYE